MTRKWPDMLRIGLKLWSTNIEMISDVISLKRVGLFDYIELYVVPGTIKESLADWRRFPGPYVIHCPHSRHGFNLADRSLKEGNLEKFDEVRLAADALKADIIVVHPGNNGTLAEVVMQLKALRDSRICVENKPFFGLEGQLCVGSRPEEISTILQSEAVGGFVLDFSHAISAANAMSVFPFELIEDFSRLSPSMFHFNDGDARMQKDLHMNLGQGSFDLQRIMSFIPPGSRVTVETPRDAERKLEDFVRDVEFLRRLCGEKGK